MKTKNILAALILMVAGLQTVNAQGFRVYKTDGTVAQFSLRTDSIVFYEGIGSDVDFGPFTPVNQCIVGTWYKSKSETVTFNEDGTTDYLENATYEFMPYQGSVIIYNSNGAPTSILKVYKVTKEKMIVSSPDGSNISVWSSTQQKTLVSEIVLSETSFSLKLDASKTLTATVLPEDADNKAVTWESSNEDVAEVNKNGRVLANGDGTCTITCRATDGSGVYAKCLVTVNSQVLVSEIRLSETSLSLKVDDVKTLTATVLPEDADNKAVTWESSDEDVAEVNVRGRVSANGEGICTIICRATDGSGVKTECQVTVSNVEVHEYVDLDLPSGTLWATCNVGASSPEEYGDYFAWGETEPKEEYNSATYKYGNGSEWSNFKLTKYCQSSSWGYRSYSDELEELTPEDDAATANWGNDWQIPSRVQLDELIDNTTQTWTTQNGVNGRLITSKINGNSIFLPAAGTYYDTDLEDASSEGNYYSRSIGSYPSPPFLYFDVNSFYTTILSPAVRFHGYSIRPVRKQ